jgi:hypothetical protein
MMRSARYSTRCARQPTLSSISWIVIVVVFTVGMLLVGISSAMLRSTREQPPAPRASWPQLIDESLSCADSQLRLDMIERLSIVGTAWSREILERAKAEDPDPHVRSMAQLALDRAGATAFC